jgi:hypothetical protein
MPSTPKVKYMLIKVNDSNVLSGFINNTIVSLPSYYKSMLTASYKASDVKLLFMTKNEVGSDDIGKYNNLNRHF